MNYEDRTGLLTPEQVVSAAVLSKLRLIPDAARLIALAVDDAASAPVTSAAHEAILQRVAQDTAPDSGAPPQAKDAEEDAMLSGYRFGQLALEPGARRRSIAPEVIQRRTESMNLYALLVWDASTPGGQIPVAAILSRHQAQHIYALEEAVTWAWAFGLGVAVVEADLDTAE